MGRELQYSCFIHFHFSISNLQINDPNKYWHDKNTEIFEIIAITCSTIILFYFSLEYDTTLCKAAFLPELSIERRVDVPKKFILSDGDLDSTSSKDLKFVDDAEDVKKIRKVEDNGDNQVGSFLVTAIILYGSGS